LYAEHLSQEAIGFGEFADRPMLHAQSPQERRVIGAPHQLIGETLNLRPPRRLFEGFPAV